jgi:hypothetical protein
MNSTATWEREDLETAAPTDQERRVFYISQ